MDTKSDEEWAYRIAIQGRLNESWSRWFSGMTITVEKAGDGQTVTTLTGPVVDQSALRGILNKLWDLNLILISVTRLEKEIPSPKEANHVTPIRSLTR